MYVTVDSTRSQDGRASVTLLFMVSWHSDLTLSSSGGGVSTVHGVTPTADVLNLLASWAATQDHAERVAVAPLDEP